MSSAIRGSVDFDAIVRAVRRVIDTALREGSGTGLPALADRLDTLLRPDVELGPHGQFAIAEQVHFALISVMTACLQEEVRKILVERLRATQTAGEFADDPWAPLDPDASALRMDAVRTRKLIASRSALRASRHFRETRRPGYLRDAVKILESARLYETRITGSRLTPANCDEEFARLGAALAQSMPPCAWSYFSQLLRGEIAAACKASGLRMGPKVQACLRSWFADDRWSVDLESVPIVTGAWFVTPVQQWCDEMLGHEREAREAEAAKRAEQQRRFDAWTARRNAERHEDAAHDAADEAPEEGRADEERADSRRRADGLVLVNLPDGPKWLEPHVAAACEPTLPRWRRDDEAKEREEEERREYYAKIGRPYEPRARRHVR